MWGKRRIASVLLSGPGQELIDYCCYSDVTLHKKTEINVLVYSSDIGQELIIWTFRGCYSGINVRYVPRRESLSIGVGTLQPLQLGSERW